MAGSLVALRLKAALERGHLLVKGPVVPHIFDPRTGV
jgi:hypothetical protein